MNSDAARVTLPRHHTAARPQVKGAYNGVPGSQLKDESRIIL